MKAGARGSLVVDVLSVVSLVVFGLAVAVALGLQSLVPESRSKRTTAGLEPAEFASLFLSGLIEGENNAPVKVLVYSDFRCGYSRELYFTLAEMALRYPEHLAVSWKFLSDDSNPRARAFLVPEGVFCAGRQRRSMDYVHAAFQNTSTLDFSDAANRLGSLIALPDSSGFQDCLDRRIFAYAVAAVSSEAERLGISSSPTLFVNGERIPGAPPSAVLDSIVVQQFSR